MLADGAAPDSHKRGIQRRSEVGYHMRKSCHYIRKQSRSVVQSPRRFAEILLSEKIA